jgi:hypothetical protein
MNIPAYYVSNPNMSNGLTRVFEWVSGWREYSDFERDHEGHITTERVGDGAAMFLWRVDKEPAHLDHMYLDGRTMVRFTDNAH